MVAKDNVWRTRYLTKKRESKNMASADYSEDNNIQEPAAKLFEDNLDWRSVYALTPDLWPGIATWSQRCDRSCTGSGVGYRAWPS